MNDNKTPPDIGEKAESARGLNAVQVISRAANILWVLRDHPGGLSLSALAKRVGLARSTVYRIVNSLIAENWVAWSESTNTATLGLALVALGAAVNTDLRREIRPHLERLSHQLDETVDLAILDRKKALFIDQVAAPQRLQAVSGVGTTFPLHSTANGKALLSLLSWDRAAALLPPKLEADTRNTIVDKGRLRAELEAVRKEGLAYDREEHTLGIGAVGIAFRDPRGTLAAISIPVPSVRFYGNEESLGRALKEAAAHALGMYTNDRLA